MIHCPECDDDFEFCECEFTDAETAEIRRAAREADIENEAERIFNEGI